LKPAELRNRRRQDNNNNLDLSSILVVNTEQLRSNLHRSSTANNQSKTNIKLFDADYLRLTNRR